LQTLYWHLPGWSGVLSQRGAAALDLAGRGSLASWFSALLRGVCAAASLVVYSIRRHKADIFLGIPSMYNALAALKEAKREDLATLRLPSIALAAD
jgi:hypothetical protein